MPNDVAKIRSVLRQEVSAVNAGDLEAWKKVLTNDIAFMAPDAPRAKGIKPSAPSQSRRSSIRSI
jgi:ketosteroid isomerase-like protein